MVTLEPVIAAHEQRTRSSARAGTALVAGPRSDRRGTAQEAAGGPLPLYRQLPRARDCSTTGRSARTKFVKVFPNEYRRALAEMYAKRLDELGPTRSQRCRHDNAAGLATGRVRRVRAKAGRAVPDRGVGRCRSGAAGGSAPTAPRKGARVGGDGPGKVRPRASAESRQRTGPRRHGQDHRLYGDPARRGASEADRVAGQALQGIRRRACPTQAKVQGARCMDCGMPFCNTAARSTTSSRTGTTWCIAATGSDAIDDAALDQQLPRVHRPHLPGAVRGGLHAEHQHRPGRHQVDRARDHRQGLGRRLGIAAGAGHEDRQEGRGRRFGAGRPGLRPATGSRRP